MKRSIPITNGRSTGGRRHSGLRLLIGILFAAVVFGAASRPANAAVTASFTVSNGTLTVFGDSLGNSITISRDAAGKILVNNGAVAVAGGTPTVANTTLVSVFGQAGNDSITLNEALGALPAANLFGGVGNDTLIAGSGGDLLFGQAGNDTLLGKGGFDFVFGGADDDTLTGGDADDQVFGESGNDRMVWNPGDDTDLNEGAAGSDTVEVNGGGAAEMFTATANGTRVRFDRVEPGPFSIDIGTSEKLVVNANGSDDRFSAIGNLAPLIAITVDGGAGGDTILGSNGVDTLAGGDGSDFVDGQQGNDVASLGANDDVFQWDPGDGSDTVEGQAGTDRMLFNGSAGAERFEASANGGRVRFTRDLGNIVIDLDDVESLDLNALGNTDTLTVNDLNGTDLVEIDGDLAGTIGGTAGDGAADSVVVYGTNGDDVIDVVGSGTSASVLGLATRVNVTSAEAANDSLVVNAVGGDDDVTATTLPADVIKLTIDGGAGEDQVFGSQGADVLHGGAGDDFVLGDNGNDVALMGSENDLFQWNPGDGNDTLEGQGGADSMLFFGAGVAESIHISENGGRVLFFRNIAGVTMDLDDVESIDFRALGGADIIDVGDLSGTDLTSSRVDLSGPNGGGDGAPDTISVNGTQGIDAFGAASDAAGVQVAGLHTAVGIISGERANDGLTLDARGGDDAVDATSLAADAIQLSLNGGLGADVLRGSPGADLLGGGEGDDVALMGDGDDSFVWNPGDDNDTLEGQGGLDEMLFNGAPVAESIDIAADGGRVSFLRDIAGVTMDLDDVESIDFRALGGADTIVVGDLSGTDVIDVNTDLASSAGVGDAQADSVVVNGTDGDDVSIVAGDASGVTALGLAAQVNITGAEGANDRLTLDMLAGDDVVDASGLAAGAILLTINGGDGNDVLIGGAGDDVLSGGPGDDVLLGGGGIDVIDGGDGDDIEIQSVGFDAVRSAATAGEGWLAAHARTVKGKTVLELGGEDVELPRAKLSQLVQGATTA